MSIQEWAAIAEIVGAVAVVASLVYLAVQIRQNTHGLSMTLKSTELAAFERNVEAGNRIREIFILNSDILELYERGLKSYADLGSADKMRFGMVLSNVFSAFQGAFVRQLTYGSDPTDFAGSELLIDSYIKFPGVREWLREERRDWRPQFAKVVKQRVKIFEDTIEKGSAEGSESSPVGSDE